jgi:energy-coupling factor transporter ATP-binding protein EcfA2
MTENKIIPVSEWLDQFPELNDHMLVSDYCWSKHDIRTRLWNYAQMISHGQYVISPEDKQSYADLCKALHEGKCIVLRGKHGSGKSTLTRMASKILFPKDHPNRYQFTSVFKIIEEFSKKGFEAIEKYYSGFWVFDDVGRELEMCKGTQIKGGGPMYNVMSLILDAQYKNIPAGKAGFIISTNRGDLEIDGKKVNELEVLYTPQVFGRIKQVSVFIKINGSNYRDIFSVNMITHFPEVMHPKKDEPMTDQEKNNAKRIRDMILTELVSKYGAVERNQKRDPKKFLKPTTFEATVEQWFDEQWLKQHNPIKTGSGNAYIIYEEKEYERKEFVEFCRTLKPKEENVEQ